MEKELFENGLTHNRRRFLSKASLGLGTLALGSLLTPNLFKGKGEDEQAFTPGIPSFAPKAKRVIYLFQNGAPSQLESFDYKPKLTDMFGQELPDSVRGEQRLTGMTAGQSSFPLVGSFTGFKQYGESRAWISDLFPYTSKIVDDLLIMIQHLHFYKRVLSKEIDLAWERG
jgi:hypothetical protein